MQCMNKPVDRLSECEELCLAVPVVQLFLQVVLMSSMLQIVTHLAALFFSEAMFVSFSFHGEKTTSASFMKG